MRERNARSSVTARIVLESFTRSGSGLLVATSYLRLLIDQEWPRRRRLRRGRPVERDGKRDTTSVPEGPTPRDGSRREAPRDGSPRTPREARSAGPADAPPSAAGTGRW